MPKKNEDTTSNGMWGAKLETDKTDFRKATALEDGQSIEGTVLAFRESAKYPGKFGVVMRGTDGKTFTLSPAGNLNYAIRDGLLKVGTLYKIQREGTKLVKGMKAAQFGIYPAINSNGSSPAPANDDI